MTKIKQHPDELKKQLREQFRFLQKSALEFDKGDESEAKRMATSIRILLHDKRSESLLSILGIKDKIKFLNTASAYNPDNLLSHFGLAEINLCSNNEKTSAQYKARLDEFIKILGHEDWQSFKSWWEMIVIADRNKNKFTRKDIILNIADTDGGAHVDREINKEYADLSRNNSMNWSLVSDSSGKKDVSPIMAIELVSVRQITYEVLLSLKEYL